jgi:hypothetical protein
LAVLLVCLDGKSLLYLNAFDLANPFQFYHVPSPKR